MLHNHHHHHHIHTFAYCYQCGVKYCTECDYEEKLWNQRPWWQGDRIFLCANSSYSH